jgi:hypothetical protein
MLVKEEKTEKYLFISSSSGARSEKESGKKRHGGRKKNI